MNRFYLTLVGICIGLSAIGQEPVLYGERSADYRSDETTTRIFLDRQGDFYPDMFIADDELSASDHNLSAYFKDHPSAVEEARRLLGFEQGRVSRITFNRLQDSLERGLVRSINDRLAPDMELFVLIHGFRKPLREVASGFNSKQDFDTVKSSIRKNRPNAKIHFLEVYWDGTYINIKPSIGGVIQLGKLFKNQAVLNATRVGQGLRNVISRIDHPRIHIIAHSLGAQVVNNILWNANGPSGGLTPAQKIDVCLIAPAIARKPFRNYMDRTGVIYIDQDNYSYSIIYNERDIVVAKSNFGDRRYFRFTRFYGNTKLGCNCSREAIKVEHMFRKRYPTSSIGLYDATEVGNNHKWGAYTESQAFSDYMNSF